MFASEKAAHCSGACYDAINVIQGVEYGGRVRPPLTFEAPILVDANKQFSGEVRYAPAWGDQRYGCST
jgi:hypothetical protein